ncbi:hypothetical protein NADFUDRAFT_81045 [Nadsonia fulvescens var. elongata DSM 6958]|uniref:Uncharacterized protein n=1 Tax=Nadsonia fulvescens var. elongata DSM 6958 TaxID=857566 RepID=A0A1E3PSY4_9ASCO|nr:hypothetical protein NADFUDRAFT_81045 [Nadsonia fulvescens var. elongata DSM 6958]
MYSLSNKDLESDVLLRRFKQELSDIKQRFDSELIRCKNQGEKEINEQEKSIHDITSRKLQEEQSQQHLNKLLHDNEKETRMLQISIDDIAVDEGKISYAKSSLKDIEQQKDDMEKKIENLDIKTKISEESWL